MRKMKWYHLFLTVTDATKHPLLTAFNDLGQQYKGLEKLRKPNHVS